MKKTYSKPAFIFIPSGSPKHKEMLALPKAEEKRSNQTVKKQSKHGGA